jgi:hypothetical protein
MRWKEQTPTNPLRRRLFLYIGHVWSGKVTLENQGDGQRCRKGTIPDKRFLRSVADSCLHPSMASRMGLAMLDEKISGKSWGWNCREINS